MIIVIIFIITITIMTIIIKNVASHAVIAFTVYGPPNQPELLPHLEVHKNLFKFQNTWIEQRNDISVSPQIQTILTSSRPQLIDSQRVRETATGYKSNSPGYKSDSPGYTVLYTTSLLLTLHIFISNLDFFSMAIRLSRVQIRLSRVQIQLSRVHCTVYNQSTPHTSWHALNLSTQNTTYTLLGCTTQYTGYLLPMVQPVIPFRVRMC